MIPISRMGIASAQHHDRRHPRRSFFQAPNVHSFAFEVEFANRGSFMSAMPVENDHGTRETVEGLDELLRNVGDGRGQAASGCWLTASMPSMNFTPVISFGNWLWPSRRRQLFSAACASLKTMAIAVLVERHPLERTVRCRTVANVLSMGLVVRRCFQCSAGKS